MNTFHFFTLLYNSNRNKVIAIKEGISSLTYWKSKAENNSFYYNRDAGTFLYLRQLNVISHNCNAEHPKSGEHGSQIRGSARCRFIRLWCNGSTPERKQMCKSLTILIKSGR